MPRCQDVSVTVLLGDENSKEYAVESEDTVTTCYIASEVEKAVTFKLSNERNDYMVRFTVTMDGTFVNSYICRCAGERTIPGARTADWQEREIFFSNLTTTDDHSRVAQGVSAQHLGLIEVQAHRVITQPPRELGESKSSDYCDISDGAVHERSKKAGSHRATLGKIKTPRPLSVVEVTHIDPSPSPLCTFSFRYRPLAILQAQGIVPIPQQPSPPPVVQRRDNHDPANLGQKRKASNELDTRPPQRPRENSFAESDEDNKPVLDESDDEIKTAEAEMQNLQAKLDRLRAHRGRQGSRVKREPSVIRLPAGTSGGVIDLTMDD